MATVRAVLRQQREGDPHYIYLLVTVGSVPRPISLRATCTPEHWDPGDSKNKIPARVLPSHHDHHFLNQLIRKKFSAAEQVLNLLQLNNIPITHSAFSQYWGSAGGGASTDFKTFANDLIELKRKKKLHEDTLGNYTQCVNKVCELRPGISLFDINHEFLERFEAFLIDDCRHELSTVAKHLSHLRMFVKKAFARGIIKANPFAEFQISGARSQRMPLSSQQLLAIRNLEIPEHMHGLERARRRFLFQCCTSMAFVDMLAVQWSQITEHAILRPRKKSKEQQNIPLLDLTRWILDQQKAELEQIRARIACSIDALQRKLSHFQETASKDSVRIGRLKRRIDRLQARLDSNCVFESIANFKYNKHLKTLAAMAKIEIDLISHVARYTFATQALNAGVSKEAVMDIMGITQEKTLRIYQRVADEFRVTEMKKMENIQAFRLQA